ncbi:MAG TPA: autotransporter-associated beta strand repeat-containing protein, partial [Pirellulales bacterium]
QKLGAGSLTISGANNLQGNVEVSDGTLAFDVSAPPMLAAGFAPTVDGTGTLELDGTVSALTGGSSGTNIVNTSTAPAGVLVNGSGQFAGGIDGTGTLVIANDAALTANHVVQGALVIGGSPGHPAMLTIAASDASGNPLAVGQAFPFGYEPRSRRQPDGATSGATKSVAVAASVQTTKRSPPQATAEPTAVSDGSSLANSTRPSSTPTLSSSLSLRAEGRPERESLTYDEPATYIPPGARLDVNSAFAAARFALATDDSLIDLLALVHHRPHRGRGVVQVDATHERVAD